MITIKSPAFIGGQAIPTEYSCRGRDVNPPLEIGSVPTGTKSLALLVDDPDAPVGDWVHWLVWNINPRTAKIEANQTPPGSQEGKGSSGNNKYEGPCPPSGTHHYKFKIYALDDKLNLNSGASKTEFLRAIYGHVIDQSTLTGIFSY